VGAVEAGCSVGHASEPGFVAGITAAIMVCSPLSGPHSENIRNFPGLNERDLPALAVSSKEGEDQVHVDFAHDCATSILGAPRCSPKWRPTPQLRSVAAADRG
jgi:hypothetical protein